jgi:hypothetical protein
MVNRDGPPPRAGQTDNVSPKRRSPLPGHQKAIGASEEATYQKGSGEPEPVGGGTPHRRVVVYTFHPATCTAKG